MSETHRMPCVSLAMLNRLAAKLTRTSQIETKNSSTYANITDLFSRVKAAALVDITSHILKDMPDVLYPCQKCHKQWLDWDQLLWSCIIAIGATWSIAYWLVGALIERLHEKGQTGVSPQMSAYRVSPLTYRF